MSAEAGESTVAGLPPIPEIDRDTIPLYPDLKGKVAFVTGGANGIGAATCRVLAANGVRVAVADFDGDGAVQIAAKIRAWEGEAVAIPVNVCDEEGLERARLDVEEAFGPVDIVAPFAGGFGSYVAIDEMTAEEWRSVVELNLTSPFLTVKEFLPTMTSRGSGVIITMGSSSARYLDVLGTSPYIVSKGGVLLFTRHLAGELGPRGIRVNCVCPSTTRSERADRLIGPERQAELAAMSPLGRMGLPADTAHAVAFLASDVAAGWITGACLDVAGGRIMV